jgi:predicted nuclease of restriction endonuclease-like (RecB) superfamily
MNLQKKNQPVRRYRKLLTDIGSSIERAKHNAALAINRELVKLNWEIGKHIVVFEQHGNEKAEYGSELLNKLSHDLKMKFRRGFSRRNVSDMRRFYIEYPIWQAVPAKLNWTHLILLLSIDDSVARNFYAGHCISENWSSRELQRQINASLYERVTLSKNKKQLLSTVKKSKVAGNYQDFIKDPYILDFLGHKGKMSERAFEQALIDNMQAFLLELGKGFAFVGRQFKIPIRNKIFSVDLVFYHRILKCFVLFDLKTRFVKHTDIGQMNLYLNYFKAEENVDGDTDPIGIILSAGKDEILVEYAMGGLSNKIFVSRYQMYLPEKKELRKQLADFILSKRKLPRPRKLS